MSSVRKDNIALAKNNGFEDNNKMRYCGALYYFQTLLSHSILTLIMLIYK